MRTIRLTESRLLGVYEKLRLVNAFTATDDEQQQLVEQANSLVVQICNDHVFAAEAYLTDEPLRDDLVAKIKAECQELIEYIIAAKRFNLEINARSKDRVISFGERLSCLYMTSLLQSSVCFPWTTTLCCALDTYQPNRESRQSMLT